MNRYQLYCPAGYYEATTMFDLFWEVLRHRAGHWLRGEGWTD